MCNFLDLNLETPLSVSVEGGGEGSMNGSTRKRIVEQRETLRGSVLTSALEHYSDQTARPVLVWPQKDKLSSAWLLALPGPVTGLTSPIFSEAVCSSLCLPSPSCRERVGEKIGKTTVDLYGDRVMATPLSGDSWRIRHDTVKTELNRLIMWCGLPATCEVFGLFSHLIPQEGLSRMERGRERQGMVPDFMMDIPNPTGEVASRLAELKVLNCCPSRYSLSDKGKAVDKRARLLQGEYKRKARNADQVYGGHNDPDHAGPVERKLLQFGEVFGLVVGAFGEASEDLHLLIQHLAESRIRTMRLKKGHEAFTNETGIIVEQIRRSFSTTCVRAQAQCLISRMNNVGEGYAMAAKRRQWAARQEENMRKERQSQWLGRIRGSNLIRRGQFKLI